MIRPTRGIGSLAPVGSECSFPTTLFDHQSVHERSVGGIHHMARRTSPQCGYRSPKTPPSTGRSFRRTPSGSKGGNEAQIPECGHRAKNAEVPHFPAVEKTRYFL